MVVNRPIYGSVAFGRASSEDILELKNRIFTPTNMKHHALLLRVGIAKGYFLQPITLIKIKMSIVKWHTYFLEAASLGSDILINDDLFLPHLNGSVQIMKLVVNLANFHG